MKKITQSVALALVGLALTTSCKKDTVAPAAQTPATTPPTFSTANVQAMFTNMATPLETFVVSATNYNTHICANGTKIMISPNAFLNQSGGVVTGNVTIEVKDVLSKKDMILNNAIPISNGQLLVSGGEVYFNATQGGQKLKINPGVGAVLFQVPAGNTPDYQMQKFYAQGGSNLSNTNLNWNTPATPTGSMVVQDSTGFVYNFYCDSVQWANCDYLWNASGAKTTCTVNTTGASDNSNTAIFVSMNGTNVLMYVHSDSYTSVSQTFVSYINSLPIGSNYTVVAIKFDGTNYFYASQAITMSANMVVTMPALTQTTLAQIKTNLTTLP